MGVGSLRPLGKEIRRRGPPAPWPTSRSWRAMGCACRAGFEKGALWKNRFPGKSGRASRISGSRSRAAFDGIGPPCLPHTVRFSHDIFFEWAFFHVLVDREEAWLNAIRDCGEPPAIGRVVEL